MIRINDFFQLERKKHGWNLYHNIPKRTQDGRLIYKKRTTYYSDIYDSMLGVIHHSLNGSLSAYLAPEYTQQNYPDQNHIKKQHNNSSDTLSSNNQSNDNEEEEGLEDENLEDENLEDEEEYEEDNLDQRFQNHVDYQLESVEQIKEMLDNIHQDIKQSIFDYSDQVIIGQKLYNIKDKMAEDEAKTKKKK